MRWGVTYSRVRKGSQDSSPASPGPSPPPYLPHFLRRPVPRPRRADEVERRRRALRCAHLDQVLDREPVRSQEADPIAVAEMEIDGAAAGPLEAVRAEVGAQQTIGGGRAVLLLHAEREQRAVGEEDQLPARTEHACGFGDPPVRIGPQTRAVLGD